MDLMAADISWL